MEEEEIIPRDVMLYLKDTKVAFRCDCGCNVFRKTTHGRYRCNSCFTFWREGTSSERSNP